ncbi:ribosome-binding factor A [Ereboglobus sp. PH5-5]|uniref:30S ribosome-binding factor RbfA n=1 Tax=unclassified Ereboglobus TaxID=2626932 RepID=UPI002404CA72|nr:MULTISPECIES: 30S ribosome-binding factor RbfA [unclassified Ereboglobus]MDF9827944.1 ribosome-binding factor A [Ereboglobus sp. PH5-10]MDF9834273.1 ribosome-binding factor A [Ereboglobus sp. PH5-5]
MSNRTLRVNELIQRELSDILRKRYQSEAVTITISAVSTAPDLRDCRVHVSVVGDPDFAGQKLRWLRKKEKDLRQELGRRIILKYMPKFTFALDTSTARGNRILGILDELEEKAEKPKD